MKIVFFLLDQQFQCDSFNQEVTCNVDSLNVVPHRSKNLVCLKMNIKLSVVLTENEKQVAVWNFE